MQKRKKIFFSGIGGSGMSSLAVFAHDRGHTISGSDRAFDLNTSHPVLLSLKKSGIRLFPQDGSGITSDLDLAVFSTAVEPDRPEVIRTSELGIPAKTRPEYLAEMVPSFRTIAVAGTSGKSTVSGMLAFLMHRLGLNPNFIGGGRVKQFRKEGNPGNSLTGDSDYLVIEACESDGTIVDYRPEISLILNLDFDHHPVDKTAAMFKVLINNTSGKVFMNADDRNLAGLIRPGFVTFSIDTQSAYRAEKVESRGFGSGFSVHGVRMELNLPGKYNVCNALACISVLADLGIPLKRIAQELPGFTGIERRFDIHLDNGKSLVIDDYAHNPHKIASLMEAVGEIRDRVCYIFQPHGFAPTRMMKNDYISVFSRLLRPSDHLVLLPIFYAGGTVSREISSADLAEGVRDSGKSAEVLDRHTYIRDRANLWDNHIVLGARDETLSVFAREIAEAISSKKAA